MPNSQPLLTIAIPTFDRNEQLLQTLSDLLPQLTDACELLIIDNASPIAVEDTTRLLLSQYSQIATRLIRNAINIGGNANLCRCIELAAGEYLWILSDDDQLLPDSIQTVLDTIVECSSAVFINFSSSMHERPEQVFCDGIDDFVAKIDDFSNILFVSTSIYHAATLRSQLRFAYHYCYTWAPHFVALLMSLGDLQRCVLSEKRIIGWEPASSEAQRWPVVLQALGMMAILELPLLSATRRQLAYKLAAACTQPKVLFYQLLKQELSTGDRAAAHFYSDQLRYRLRYHGLTINRRIALVVYDWLLYVPELSLGLIRVSCRIFGTPSAQSLKNLASLDRL